MVAHPIFDGLKKWFLGSVVNKISRHSQYYISVTLDHESVALLCVHYLDSKIYIVPHCMCPARVGNPSHNYLRWILMFHGGDHAGPFLFVMWLPGALC